MKEIYQAYDGKTFDVKEDCIEYEHAKYIGDDVELYSVDFSGNFLLLEPNEGNVHRADTIVIKTELGAAWVNSILPFGPLPSKPGIYAYGYSCGWAKWNGTIQELADKKVSFEDWSSYISYLQSWAYENEHFTNVGGSPMSYSEYLELERTLKEARDDR